MISIEKITGRLGNQMFQFAFLFAYAQEHKVDHYFQDPMWFEKFEKDIKALYGHGIPKKTDMVSIHIRRGDYVNNRFYIDLCESDYYEQAIKMFPNEKFLVFSDDIEWCKVYFKDRGFEFVDVLNPDGSMRSEVDDMNLMASCKHNIIANSTFSWWAAFLNPNKDKKVIAPRDWFVDGLERTVCPIEWIKI